MLPDEHQTHDESQPTVVEDSPATPEDSPAHTADQPSNVVENGEALAVEASAPLTDVATEETTPSATRESDEPPAPEADEEDSPQDSVAEADEDEDEVSGEPAPPAATGNLRWYVVKVQSGREESIKEAIERRVRIEGLEEFFGQVVIPVEKVTEMRGGRKVTRTRKLYPGYLMCEVEFNDRILYLFRETSGVGDFVGGSFNRPPTPMSQREVDAMLGRAQEVTGVIQAKPKFDRGDRVRVKDGTFAAMEGEVKELIESKNLVKVELTIFGRPVPVELEYWQVEMI